MLLQVTQNVFQQSLALQILYQTMQLHLSKNNPLNYVQYVWEGNLFPQVCLWLSAKPGVSSPTALKPELNPFPVPKWAAPEFPCMALLRTVPNLRWLFPIRDQQCERQQKAELFKQALISWSAIGPQWKEKQPRVQHSEIPSHCQHLLSLFTFCVLC